MQSHEDSPRDDHSESSDLPGDGEDSAIHEWLYQSAVSEANRRAALGHQLGGFEPDDGSGEDLPLLTSEFEGETLLGDDEPATLGEAVGQLIAAFLALGIRLSILVGLLFGSVWFAAFAFRGMLSAIG